MSTFKKFTDIEAWQKARVLTASVYRITRLGPLARDFGLRDQMCRASVSIMANIAEGFDRGGNREFVRVPRHCKGLRFRGAKYQLETRNSKPETRNWKLKLGHDSSPQRSS